MQLDVSHTSSRSDRKRSHPPVAESSPRCCQGAGEMSWCGKIKRNLPSDSRSRGRRQIQQATMRRSSAIAGAGVVATTRQARRLRHRTLIVSVAVAEAGGCQAARRGRGVSTGSAGPVLFETFSDAGQDCRKSATGDKQRRRHPGALARRGGQHRTDASVGEDRREGDQHSHGHRGRGRQGGGGSGSEAEHGAAERKRERKEERVSVGAASKATRESQSEQEASET